MQINNINELNGFIAYNNIEFIFCCIGFGLSNTFRTHIGHVVG